MFEKAFSLFVYVASVVGINYGFAYLPAFELWGAFVPSTALLVGIVFVARDYAQRHAGHWVVVAMVVGCLVSYFFASKEVAMASAAAFIVSEVTDWAVYTVSKLPFHKRVLLSSLIGTPVDGLVFLTMIGYFSLPALVLTSGMKIVAAAIIYAVYAMPKLKVAYAVKSHIG